MVGARPCSIQDAYASRCSGPLYQPDPPVTALPWSCQAQTAPHCHLGETHSSTWGATHRALFRHGGRRKRDGGDGEIAPFLLRALNQESALATWIHQRRLTPSCGGQAPTAERTVAPARMIAESLTPKPGIREHIRWKSGRAGAVGTPALKRTQRPFFGDREPPQQRRQPLVISVMRAEAPAIGLLSARLRWSSRS